jgi:mannose-6-phosphate isomerase-like protein (cupin superfamily)
MRPIEIDELEAIVPPDGSSIREVVPPGSGAGRQSLARATVEPGAETVEHLHRRSEEIYLFVSGAGRLRMGEESFEIASGQAVLIPPGTPHKLWNPGSEPLVLFCCCSPPYSDADTVLLD